MAKVSRVIVLCPNGRRQTVNLTPNTNVLQILEEVCQKQNVNPDDFDICHYKKPLDLSLPVRFANLSNNAQLELQPTKAVRKDCLVTVALQLESGERIMKDFVPCTSLWDVVEQCLNTKPDANLNEKGEPVCVYMRQKLVGDAIKETTLRGLGLTQGSAIIRLIYRNPEEFSEQAHISTPLSKPTKDISPAVSSKLSTDTIEMDCDPPIVEPEVVSEPESTQISATTLDKSSFTQVASVAKENRDSLKEINEKVLESDSVKDVSKVKETRDDTGRMLNEGSVKKPRILPEQKTEFDSSNMDQDASEEEIGAIHYIGGKHAVLYSLDDITDVKKADLPDEFFELSIDDVRYLMEEIKKTRVEIENQPLLTKELRDRQLLQKLGRFKETVIRVYFPERLVLQAVFDARETVQDVCNFIRDYLEDKSLNFYLYTAPPKEKKNPAKTLIESMLIPAAVVYFGCDKQNESYLSNNFRDKVSDPRAASMAAYESRKQAICETEETSTELDEMPISLPEIVDDDKIPGPSCSQPSSASIQRSEKVPKWLKISK